MILVDIFPLQEGLISSIDSQTVIRHLQRSFPIVTGEVLPGVSDNTFIIMVTIPSGNKQVLRNIISRMDVYGWFPSSYSAVEDKWYKEYHPVKILDAYERSTKGLQLQFEAKYDSQSNIPERLYHATPLKYVNKIKKIGLVPRSFSSLATHPDRIYLADNQRNLVNVLIPHMTAMRNNKEWAIFEVVVGDITPKIRIYRDPAYGHGYYTTQNIPPSCIRFLGKISV